MKEKEWGLTDEQVEKEIERLNASEAVALARRKAMYSSCDEEC